MSDRRPEAPEPPAPTPPARFRWPLGFLGMLPLVLGVEAYLAVTEFRRTEVIEHEWRRATDRATSAEARESGIVCFGDSMVRFGVQPRVLEERTGLAAYNLAIGGAPPAASYFQLRRLLEAGARPRALVVNFEPIFHTFSPWTRLSVWPELLNARELGELAIWMRAPDFAAAALLADVFPSVRARHVVKRHLFSRLTGVKEENTPSRNQFAQRVQDRQTLINRGSVLLAPRPEGGRDRANEFAITPEVRDQTEPTVDQGIAAFLDLARERGIPVFVVVPPRRADAIAHSRKVGALERQDRMLAACPERHPGVTVVDARDARYGPEVFNDGSHLNRDGAVTWSADLGDLVAARLAGELTTRWVALPDHRPIATREPPGEDSKSTQDWVRGESRSRRR